jgi:hypothetical protein
MLDYMWEGLKTIFQCIFAPQQKIERKGLQESDMRIANTYNLIQIELDNIKDRAAIQGTVEYYLMLTIYKYIRDELEKHRL